MNNHWEDYLAYQSVRVTFRYALRAHGSEDIAAASRFATALAARASRATVHHELASKSMLKIEPASARSTEMKPKRDQGMDRRPLSLASDEDVSAHSTRVFEEYRPKRSRTRKNPCALSNGDISIAGWDLVTLRVGRTERANGKRGNPH